MRTKIVKLLQLLNEPLEHIVTLPLGFYVISFLGFEVEQLASPFAYSSSSEHSNIKGHLKKNISYEYFINSTLGLATVISYYINGIFLKAKHIEVASQM